MDFQLPFVVVPSLYLLLACIDVNPRLHVVECELGVSSNPGAGRGNYKTGGDWWVGDG